MRGPVRPMARYVLVLAGLVLTLMAGGPAPTAVALAAPSPYAVVPSGSGPAAAGGAGDPVLALPLVIVGVGGLSWDELSAERTPGLWRVLDAGAAASAETVHTVGQSACPLGGWLSLSAGRAAPSGLLDDVCPRLPAVRVEGRGAAVTGWQALTGELAQSTYGPHIGTMGTALRDGGVCATAIGPGAALALADEAGRVESYYATPEPAAFGCPVTVVDVGVTAAVDSDRGGVLPVDRRIADVLDQMPAEATVVVTSVSTSVGTRLDMGVAIVSGPHVGATVMTTASTRWMGVTRLLDLPPSVLDAVGLPEPADFQGSPLVVGDPSGSAAESSDRLRQVGLVDGVLRATSGPLTTVLTAVALLLLGLLVRPRAFRPLVLALAIAPIAAYLVTLLRWWELPYPRTALVAGMVVITVALTVAAGVVRWRAPWQLPATVAGLGAVVMAADAVAGSPLHRGSPFGPSPLLGGRYYGFGNSTYALFAVYALVLAAALAAGPLTAGHSRRAGAVIAALGVLAVGVDIWPTWGADLGGGIALVPAFALLCLHILGFLVTGVRALLVVLAGVTVVAAVALVDWLRPAVSRSHAGRFVQQVIDGDANEIVNRKAGYAAASLGTGPAAWITLIVVVLACAAVIRPDRWAPHVLRQSFHTCPLFRTTVAAVLVALALGSAVNDYGVRIATIGGIAAVPMLLLYLGAVAAPDGDTPVPAGDPAAQSGAARLGDL